MSLIASRVRGRRAAIVIAFAISLATPCPTPLSAQYSKDPVTDYLIRQNLGVRPIGDYVAEAAQNAAQFAALKVRLSTEVKAARENFWRLYPDKPGFAKAKSDFARLLRDKDNYYLLVRIVPPLNHPGFAWITGGEVDGGINQIADPAFEAWERAARSLLEQRGLEILFTPGLGKTEMAKLDPLYQSYLVRRDWEEFRVAGRRPPDLPANVWRLALLAYEASVDNPYAAAIAAHERGSQFAAQCSAGVAKALELPTVSPTACACMEKALEGASPTSRWRLETSAFSTDTFLVAAVSRLGVREKVAACLR